MITEISKNIFHVSRNNGEGHPLYDETFCMTQLEKADLPVPVCSCVGKCQWKNRYCALYGSGTNPGIGKICIELVTDGEFSITSCGVRHQAQKGDLMILLPKRPTSVAVIKGSASKYNLVISGKLLLMQYLESELAKLPCVLHGLPAEKTENFFREIFEMYLENREDRAAASCGLCSGILYEIFQTGHTESYPQNLTRILKYMEDSFPDCGTREEIASSCGISVTTLNRLFKEHLHTTIGKYRAALRLEYARNMLEQPDLSIKIIAAECGFNSPAFFCREYKRAYGITPGGSRRMKTPEDRIKLLPGGSLKTL